MSVFRTSDLSAKSIEYSFLECDHGHPDASIYFSYNLHSFFSPKRNYLTNRTLNDNPFRFLLHLRNPDSALHSTSSYRRIRKTRDTLLVAA